MDQATFLAKSDINRTEKYIPPIVNVARKDDMSKCFILSHSTWFLKGSSNELRYIKHKNRISVQNVVAITDHLIT